MVSTNKDSNRNRTLRRVYYKLISHPFFPLLFISEAIKEATRSTFEPALPALIVLAVLSTVLWAISDDVSEVVDDVADE